MEDVLEEVVSSDDLKKFERVYHEQLRSSFVTQQAQFEYAWCLVRSKYPADIQKGIILLEDLYCNHSDSEKRDCLYYLAIGNARIKEYSKALAYVRSFLQVEPGNQQVQHLETSGSILLQSARSLVSRSVYFMLFLTVLVFSWIGSYYIPLS